MAQKSQMAQMAQTAQTAKTAQMAQAAQTAQRPAPAALDVPVPVVDTAGGVGGAVRQRLHGRRHADDE